MRSRNSSTTARSRGVVMRLRSSHGTPLSSRRARTRRCRRRRARQTPAPPAANSRRDDWRRARRWRRLRQRPRDRQTSCGRGRRSRRRPCGNARRARWGSARSRGRSRPPCSLRKRSGIAVGNSAPIDARASRKAPLPALMLRKRRARQCRAAASSAAGSMSARKRCPSRSTMSRALAAQRFRRERRGIGADVDGGRMELHEFGVGDQRSRARRHGDADAAGVDGICRDAIEMADAAGREHERGAARNARLSVGVAAEHADDAAFPRYDLKCRNAARRPRSTASLAPVARASP